MTHTDSLIALLGRASSAIYTNYHDGSHGDCEACQTYNDIETVIEAMGGASTRKDEDHKANASVHTSSPVISSEIQFNETPVVFESLLTKNSDGVYSGSIYEEIKSQILRTTEPVSVKDTESALSKSGWIIGIGGVEAVLGAAGVAHVD